MSSNAPLGLGGQQARPAPATCRRRLAPQRGRGLDVAAWTVSLLPRHSPPDRRRPGEPRDARRSGTTGDLPLDARSDSSNRRPRRGGPPPGIAGTPSSARRGIRGICSRATVPTRCSGGRSPRSSSPSPFRLRQPPVAAHGCAGAVLVRTRAAAARPVSSSDSTVAASRLSNLGRPNWATERVRAGS